MSDWTSYVNDKPLLWLLRPDNPSVRYFALKELLGREEDDPDVIQSRWAAMKSDTIQALLQNQHTKGYWGKPKRFYHDKYHGTTWRLILLAELGAVAHAPWRDVVSGSGADARVRQAVEFLFAHSQDPEGGGFCSHYDAQTDADPKGTPCLTGNMVWSLIRLGYLDDPRTQKAIQWMLKYGRYDDGAEDFKGEKPYWVGRYKADCWGNHTCMNGVIAILQALAEIPSDKHTPEIKETLKKGADYILLHHVYKRSHNVEKPIAAHYKQLGFPLFYQNDMLRMLLFLTKLNIHDPRMQEAVAYLAKKQNKQGQWKLQKTFNDKMPIPIEEKGQPSKWVTLRAITVLKRYYG